MLIICAFLVPYTSSQKETYNHQLHKTCVPYGFIMRSTFVQLANFSAYVISNSEHL